MPTFYRPDPNNPQVYDALNTPLSYEQYKAAGGTGVLGQGAFPDVINAPIPTQTTTPASIPTPAAPQPVAQPVQPTASTIPPPAPAPVTTTPPQPQTLAQQSAQGGLSAEEYLKLMTGTVTPEEKQQIYDRLGITQLEQSVFSPPTQTTQQLYQTAYNQAGLSDLKTKIQTLLDQINKARSDFNEASGVINENPFLSEASRVGRISRLSDKAQAQIGNLVNQFSQLQDLYNNGISEVNSLVSRSTKDFDTNQSLNEAKLKYLLDKAEGQIGDLQTNKTQAAYSYLPDYLKAKASATAPDLIGSSDGGYYKWDSGTGTFVQAIQPQSSNDLSNGYPFYKYPGSPTVFDSKTNQPLSYEQYKAAGGVGVSGQGAFGDVFEVGASSGTSKLLSVTEAARLGVPYGTTQEEAATLAKTPTFGKTPSPKPAPAPTPPTYSSEYEARVDYDQELKALEAAKNSGQLSGKPSEIIAALAEVYGRYVSSQEIQATIYNLFGV